MCYVHPPTHPCTCCLCCRPPAAFLTPTPHRETTSPTRIGPYKVPEGIVVWPMIYGLQNSTHNWDNPHLFQPVSLIWAGV
jgi:cytochrome P450